MWSGRMSSRRSLRKRRRAATARRGRDRDLGGRCWRTRGCGRGGCGEGRGVGRFGRGMSRLFEERERDWSRLEGYCYVGRALGLMQWSTMVRIMITMGMHIYSQDCSMYFHTPSLPIAKARRPRLSKLIIFYAGIALVEHALHVTNLLPHTDLAIFYPRTHRC